MEIAPKPSLREVACIEADAPLRTAIRSALTTIPAPVCDTIITAYASNQRLIGEWGSAFEDSYFYQYKYGPESNKRQVRSSLGRWIGSLMMEDKISEIEMTLDGNGYSTWERCYVVPHRPCRLPMDPENPTPEDPSKNEWLLPSTAYEFIAHDVGNGKWPLPMAGPCVTDMTAPGQPSTRTYRLPNGIVFDMQSREFQVRFARRDPQ